MIIWPENGRTLFETFSRVVYTNTFQRCPYSDVVVGLVWSHDPESYAGGSVCYW